MYFLPCVLQAHTQKVVVVLVWQILLMPTVLLYIDSYIPQSIQAKTRKIIQDQPISYFLGLKVTVHVTHAIKMREVIIINNNSFTVQTSYAPKYPKIMASILRLFESGNKYQPAPRYLHTAQTVGNRVLLYNGVVQDLSERSQRRLASTVVITLCVCVC